MSSGSRNKRFVKNSIGRACFVALSIILQIGWLVDAGTRAGEIFPYLTVLAELLALVAVIGVYSQNRSSASKILWIVLLLVFPPLGLCLLILVGQPWATKTMRLRFENIDQRQNRLLPPSPEVLESVAAEDTAVAGQMRYLQDWCKYPVYKNTQVEFHAQTEAAFAALKKEQRKAEKYNFMEYHAI